MSFKNQVILVTGGSRGIGKAIVEHFSAQGAKVIINYHAAVDHAKQLSHDLNKRGGDVIYLQADVSCNEAVNHMVKKIVDRWGGIDILINNAGWAKKQTLSEIKPDDMQKQLQVNIAGVVICSQAVAPVMNEHGRIINITSLAAKGGAAFPVYSATKAACNALTKCLAAELGKQKITVNAVAPAAVETDLYFSVGLDKHQQESLASTPLGFLGDVNDVANAVTFFADQKSRWITGEILYVTGGKNM